LKAADLNLAEPAATVAAQLEAQWPGIVFTSGRRSLEAQARAMSQDIAINRRFVVQTYAASFVSNACQAWVDANPQATLPSDIAAGLLSVLDPLPDGVLSGLSKHLSGEAFDCEPATVPYEALEWLEAQALAMGGKLLTREGGLIRTHWQA
jgi:hypothetical protein